MLPNEYVLKKTARVLGAILVFTGAICFAQPDVSTFLSYLPVSQKDYSEMNNGDVVTHLLKSDDSRGIAVFGFMHVSESPEFIANQFSDIAFLRDSTLVLQAGRFGNEPSVKDLDPLFLEEEDLKALRSCRSGDCDLKLSQEMIGRFAKEINWNDPNHNEEANRLFRTLLFEYAQEYQKRGNAALLQYRDKRDAINLNEETGSILKESAYLSEYLPDVYSHIKNFSGTQSWNDNEFLYWSKVSIGAKPVITLNHVLIVHGGSHRNETVVISKQVFADHYFVGSLGLTVALRTSAQSPTVLTYVNRCHVDAFDGVLGGVTRAIVRRRLCPKVTKGLQGLRESLNEAYRNSHPAEPVLQTDGLSIGLPEVTEGKDRQIEEEP